MVLEDTKVVESQQDQYVIAISAVSFPTWPPRWTWSSCVEFAKWYTGHQGESWGWAGKIEPTITVPKVGGYVLTKEGNGHMAVITKVQDSYILIIEANYIPGQVSTRSLSLEDPLIRGFK